MKLVAVIGSPNGTRGNTALLLRGVLQAARYRGVETEIFSLGELKVQPCKGCEVCARIGECPIDDDFYTIKGAMLEADGIVLASPNYMYNLSAQMKALMDRCHSMCHCQMLVGKYGAVVVTSGGPYTGMAEEYLLRILSIMGCWIVGSVCAVKAQLDDEDERGRIMGMAAHLGRQIARAIEKSETFPDQVEERERFFEALKYLVIKQKENWPYEYEYWKNHWGVGEDKGISRMKSAGRRENINLIENRSF